MFTWNIFYILHQILRKVIHHYCLIGVLWVIDEGLVMHVEIFGMLQ